MRRRLLLVLTVGALIFGPAAAAQVVEPGGTVEMGKRDPGPNFTAPAAGTPRTERIPGTGRTPGTGRIPSMQGRTERTPGTGRTAGTPRTGRPGTMGRPGELPRTGAPIGTIALDGLTLLGVGTLFLRLRRRVLA